MPESDIKDRAKGITKKKNGKVLFDYLEGTGTSFYSHLHISNTKLRGECLLVKIIDLPKWELIHNSPARLFHAANLSREGPCSLGTG